jgi:sugar lactone lactonase YvrE
MKARKWFCSDSHLAAFHCNDMVVDSKGGAYVGNYGFDLSRDLATRGRAAVIADHPTAKLAYVSPDGCPRVVADDMHFPNGCVIYVTTFKRKARRAAPLE